MESFFKPVNWNRVEDPVDSVVWDRLTSNFWLPEKVPVSNDRQSWNRLSPEMKEMVKKVFAGLTLLDTVQSRFGAPALVKHAHTLHEEEVLTNVAFMESVHAKSYSTIFSTLCSTEEIDEVFRWSETDPTLRKKLTFLEPLYDRELDDPNSEPYLRISSVLLESFLFYSGFYAPLKLYTHGNLTNTADIIRLIIRDEAVHGYYIGYKYQQIPGLTDIHENFARTAIDYMMEVESEYTENLYDPVGYTEEVKTFLKYNANKALANLGYGPMYPDVDVNPAILAALDPSANENHDFFSGSGSSYVIGKTEETSDDDWSSVWT